LPWSLLDEVVGLRAEDCWTALQSEIAECQEPTLVVSSEAFSRLDGERIAAVAQYLGGSDVRIVSYLRLPFKRMLSDYTQRIKGGYYYKSFQDFVAEVEPLISNYDRFVTGWDEHFGAQNVYLRSFDRALQSGGIEDDFAELLLGGDKSELLKFSSGARANVSPSDHAVSRMRAINRVESGLGHPAALRRVFSAVRRMAAANGALGNIANRLLTSGPIVAGQDRERIEMLAADRYDSLASRCTSGPIM
jgi:hypothetical protein